MIQSSPQSDRLNKVLQRLSPSEEHEHNSDLTKVNQEIYEHNVELATRNRILSALRKIYEIINTSLGVKETAQRLIQSIVQEVKLQKGFIALVDKNKKMLKVVAVSDALSGHEEEFVKFDRPFKKLELSLKDKNNLCVDAVVNNQQRTTNELHDLLKPIIDEAKAQEVAKVFNIQTSIIYPIVFGQEVLGVIMIGIDKHIGFLSRAEKEILDEMKDLVGIAIERAQIYTDLKSANKRLKELDKLKDEFVSIASHELRTPMTAIRSYLWLALNKSPQKLNPQMEKYLDISYKSTERLIGLVNDMLTVSRIERNKLEFHMEVFNILDTVQQVHDELKIKADEKHLDFTIQTDAKTFMVNGDKEKLREVIQNLLGNALKFTPENGKITFILEHAGKMVLIKVVDTGTGIPPEEMPKLFQKFSKIEYSYRRQAEVPGSGLGLYISKQIIHSHQGDIKVESKLNVGTTFTVFLPDAKEKGGEKK